MESTQSVVCYQADEEYTLARDAMLRGAQITYTLARDAIRDFVAITYNARSALITYQASFVGLDKKFRKHLLSEFFGGDNWNRTNDPMHVKHVL